MGFLRRSSKADSGEAQRPGARDRSRMRRRLRRQRQMREALLLDLGALVFELHRHGRREPELLQAKAAELTAVDEEVRALAEALGSDQTVMQLVATGVAGSCEQCGSLMSVDAAYCSSCGAPAVPALAGDGEGPAFEPEQATDEHVALGAADHRPQTTEETPGDEGLLEEPAPEEFAEVPVPEEFAEETPDRRPQTTEETPGGEGLIEEFAEQPAVEEEFADQETVVPDEDQIRVSRMAPEEAEAERQAEPEGEEVAAPTVANEERAGESPRGLADDALDSATKVIRTGIARGRDWLRGRRTGG